MKVKLAESFDQEYFEEFCRCEHSKYIYNNRVQNAIIDLVLFKKNNVDNSTFLNQITKIQKLQGPHSNCSCQNILKHELNGGNFIRYTLNNLDVIKSNRCIHKYLYGMFDDLFNNYDVIKEVVINQYTKVVRNRCGGFSTEKVVYLQLFENDVKYTIKMNRDNYRTQYEHVERMNILLKETKMERNAFDMNYSPITLELIHRNNIDTLQ